MENSSEQSFFPNDAVARSIRFHVGALRSDMLAQPRDTEAEYQLHEGEILSGLGYSILEEWSGGVRHIIFGQNDLVSSWIVHDRIRNLRCEMERIDESESGSGGYTFKTSTIKRTIDADMGLLGGCGDFLKQIDAHGFHPDSRMKERMVFDNEGILLERVVAIGEEESNKVGVFVRRLQVVDEAEAKFGYEDYIKFGNVSNSVK